VKGVVFNLLEDFIIEGWGDDVFDEIMSGCPLHTKEPFVGPGTYPDADLFSIVGATCARLNVPAPVAVRLFGKYCFPKLAAKYPVFLEGMTDAKTFLMSVDGVIHVEVRKLMPKAGLPKFVYRDLGPNQMEVDYFSKRQLCHFMEGMFDGVGEHFDTTIDVAHTKCTHDGAEHCTFELQFAAVSQAAK